VRARRRSPRRHLDRVVEIEDEARLLIRGSSAPHGPGPRAPDVDDRVGRRRQLARERRHAVLGREIRQPALQLGLPDGPEREPHDLLDVEEHLLGLLVALARRLAHRLANHAVELRVEPGPRRLGRQVIAALHEHERLVVRRRVERRRRVIMT